MAGAILSAHARGEIVRNTGTLALVPPAVQRSLVSDQVFRILCEEILSGRYEPGEKLPTQRTLAAELGVNMASVREAVKRLEQLRLVDVAPRRRDARSRLAGGRRPRRASPMSCSAPAGSTPTRWTNRARGPPADALRGGAAGRRAGAPSRRPVLLVGARRAASPRAQDREAAQALDWAFMQVLVEAAGNVVFRLIMNSIRELYFAQRGALQRRWWRSRRRWRRSTGARPARSSRRLRLARPPPRSPPGGGAGASGCWRRFVTLAALTPREASIFACLCDTVVGAGAAAAAGAGDHGGRLLRHLARALSATQPHRAPWAALPGRAGAARARRPGAAAAPAASRSGRGRSRRPRARGRRTPGSSSSSSRGWRSSPTTRTTA